jgi:hypothetical protein
MSERQLMSSHHHEKLDMAKQLLGCGDWLVASRTNQLNAF